MKITEVRELSNDELVSKKRDLRHEAFHLRLQQASGQLERPSRLHEIRRDVARIETTLSDRRRQVETPAK